MAMGQAKELKKLFVGFLVTMNLVGLLLIMVLFAVGEIRLSYDAKVTELFICDGPDPTNRLPGPSTTAFPSDTKQRYVCAYLQTSSPVPLGFLLSYQDKPLGWFEDKSEGWIVPESKYAQGYLFVPLPYGKDRTLTPGTYRVDIYLYRNKLGATQFVVTEP